MAMVDFMTKWFEQCQLYYPPNIYVCQQNLDSVWLSHYLCSKEIAFDNGSEFKAEFEDLCANIGLKRCPSPMESIIKCHTRKNLTSSSR